jgi:hypothetical protein
MNALKAMKTSIALLAPTTQLKINYENKSKSFHTFWIGPVIKKKAVAVSWSIKKERNLKASSTSNS